MAKLSVNVNKIATLRNARGGSVPDLLKGVQTCIDAGAPGITVHPRSDERHITRRDTFDVAAYLASRAPGVEFNIEGDPRAEWLAMVEDLKPTQATLVPVRPGEVTSEAGWSADGEQQERLLAVISHLKGFGVRVSVFVDATDEAVQWAASVGADRVELFTEPYANAYGADPAAAVAPYLKAARKAQALGMGVNAGHDLSLENLAYFCKEMPVLDEVSIGHALISDALFNGLSASVRAYLDCLRSA